ncbi:MAG: TIR domain-containing protein [Verrucomicrobia bacterium]|nr:TIR domain-containing protein [Verrucomicrobiota bacterium]
MAHDVFISHAHKDKKTADAICRKLESAQVKCWIAGRDISANQDWTEATRHAIQSSCLMVLVLSENANVAPHLEREIAHAFYTRRTILPVRLSKTPLQRDFLFYLNDVRWLDACDSSEEQYLETLVSKVSETVHGRTVTVAREAIPYHNSATRVASGYSDSWFGALQASHYHSLEMLKRISIVLILFSTVGLWWYLFSRWKSEGQFSAQNLHAIPSVPAELDATGRATTEASPPKPEYTYTRFGLWVAPNDAAKTSGRDRGSGADSAAAVQPNPASSSRPPNADANATDETERPTAGTGADLKSEEKQTSEKSNQPGPIVMAASPTEKDGPAPGEFEAKKRPKTDESHTIDLPSTQPVTSWVQSTPVMQSSPSMASTPALRSTASVAPTPAVQSSPPTHLTAVGQSTPRVESDATGPSTPSVKSALAVESALAAEPTPRVESTPSQQSTPRVESTRSTQSAPSGGSTLLVQSAPAVNTTPPRPSTQAVETTPGAQVATNSNPSAEKQLVKELILDYLRTVSSDDASAQGRFFSWRVNFFGKGLLSVPEVKEAMEHYRQEWPVRNWEPRGEPEFPKALHSTHSELYEVLQPFAWTVAKGSQRKNGIATLYARIRRDSEGQFHIIDLELRHP